MAFCPVSLNNGGLPIPNSPYPGDSLIFIDFPNGGSNPNIEVLANPQTSNLQDLKSSTFGQVTDQDVWAFKANRLACAMAALSALAKEMQDTVTPLHKQVWYDSINVIAPQMAQLSNLTITMCNKVGETVNK